MGILLIIPFFLIRFGLLSLVSREAVGRAAYFAPIQGGEKLAYWFYQLSNAAILIDICFLKPALTPVWLFRVGLAAYGVGLILLAISVVNFASPAKTGINQNGLYRFSRNPMYVAYFVFFLGCVLITHSLVLLALVLLFQGAAHWIILSEERWCIQQFGKEYLQYMERVRRYL